MSMGYIRNAYKVPAKRGVRVEYTGEGAARQGVITGTRGPHVLIRLDGETTARPYHPTWELRYLDALPPVERSTARIAELEAELADARLEIEGAKGRSKSVAVPTRERCQRVAERVRSKDDEAAGLIDILPYYIDSAATWRGIAAAMGYEPLAHKDARPIGKWLNDRVAMFRAKVVAASLTSTATEGE